MFRPRLKTPLQRLQASMSVDAELYQLTYDLHLSNTTLLTERALCYTEVHQHRDLAWLHPIHSFGSSHLPPLALCGVPESTVLHIYKSTSNASCTSQERRAWRLKQRKHTAHLQQNFFSKPTPSKITQPEASSRGTTSLQLDVGCLPTSSGRDRSRPLTRPIYIGLHQNEVGRDIIMQRRVQHHLMTETQP